MTVDPALLTVIADNKSRCQGTANPPLTFSYSGLVDGDTGCVFAGAMMLAVTGSYAINQGSLSAGANYTIDYTAGTLTVTQAAQAAAPVPVNPNMPSIIAVLGQANNLIDPTLIMERDINPLSLIYLGLGTSVNVSLPSVGNNPGVPDRTFITPNSVIDCDQGTSRNPICDLDAR